MDWNQITIKKYDEIMDIIQEGLDSLEMNIALINCIFGIKAEDIPVAKLTYYINELSFLKNPPVGKKPKSQYKVGDKLFNVTLDVSKITTAQYIDFQTLIKTKDVKRLLAVLFVPDGTNYGDTDESDFLYDNLTIDVYTDVMFFFANLWKKLMLHILHSSKKMIKMKLKTEKNKQKRIPILRNLVKLEQMRLLVNDNELFGLTELAKH